METNNTPHGASLYSVIWRNTPKYILKPYKSIINHTLMERQNGTTRIPTFLKRGFKVDSDHYLVTLK